MDSQCGRSTATVAGIYRSRTHEEKLENVSGSWTQSTFPNVAFSKGVEGEGRNDGENLLPLHFLFFLFHPGSVHRETRRKRPPREGRSAAGRGRLRWCTLYRGSTCRGASAGSFGGSVAVATLAVLHSPAFAFSFIAASVILCYRCFRRRGVGYPLCPYARYGLSRMAAPPLPAKQDVRQFPVRVVLSPFSRVTTAAG